MRVCQPEVSLEGLGVVAKESVDQSKQLHHSFVLSQVLVTFQQEHIVPTIATCVRERGSECVCVRGRQRIQIFGA